MASTDDAARIEAALRLIHHWARAKRWVITEKATLEHQALGFDADDVAAVVLTANIGCVQTVSQDHQLPERTVIVMHVRTEDLTLYVKVSLRIEKDHNVSVLSFHRLGM